MITKEYKIIVKNTDMYGEKSFEKSSLEFIKEKNKIIYKFDTKLGNCIVQLKNNILFFERSGKYFSNFKLELNKKNEFVYKTEFFANIFIVKANKINFNEESNDLEFSYMILDDKDNIINEINTFIKVI